MGTVTIYLVLLISLTTISAQIFRPNRQYEFSDSSEHFRPIDTRTADSRKARRIILPEGKGRKSRYENLDLEFDDYEDDDRSYTVGARLQVQHSTPKYEKSNYDSNIATSYTILHENVPKKITLAKQKSRNKPIFKSASKKQNFYDVNSESEDISYENGKESEEFKQNLKKPKLSYPREFDGVASKKQIAEYLKDQQKLIDEVIKLRLLNDPNPGARAKYQQFLKAKDDERIEKEYEEELKRKPLALFRPNIEQKRRLPRKNQSKIKNIYPPPLPRTSSLGFSPYSNSVPLSMTFHVDV